MRRFLLLSGCALALTACGTTVPDAGLRSSGTGAADGLGQATQQEGSTSPGGTTDPGALASGGGSVTGTGGTSGTTGATGATGATTPGAGPTTSAGRAVTSGPVRRSTAPVRVGVLYIEGADTVANGLGISGLSTGDTAAQAKAVADHLNAHGGIGGRPVALYYGKLAASQMSSDQDGAHAAACAQLAQDDKVAYVISYVQLTTNQLACYAKRGVTVLDDQSSTPDAAGAKYAATFGSPGELALGRAATELVEALWRRGWLTSASKVGTLVFDTPDGIALETRYLKPALARHGLTPVTARESSSADGANQNSTVLHFRSAGVDRVIPLGANPLFLMNAAESQGYRPRYALTSTFGPGALLESAAPPNQLKGAAGIGWSKYLDIGSGTKPGAVSPNETLCFSIMKAHRQQSSQATVQAFQVALCNVLFFLEAAGERYGLTPTLLDAVRSGGLDFGPSDAFAVRMVRGRADGVAAYRDLVYSDACSCFQYDGGNRPTR